MVPDKPFTDIASELIDTRYNNPYLHVVVEGFRKHGVMKAYKKHDYIFVENDEPAAAYYVESGLAKISQSVEHGQTITLFLRYPGETFGNAEILAGLKRRQRSARCLCDSRIIALDTERFVDLAKQDAEFAYALSVIGAQRLLQTQRFVETLISRPAAWRLACLLIRLGKQEEERMHVTLQLNHEEISYIVGCSRQTVTETLNKWRDQGLISYSRTKLVIEHYNRFLTEI